MNITKTGNKKALKKRANSSDRVSPIPQHWEEIFPVRHSIPITADLRQERFCHPPRHWDVGIGRNRGVKPPFWHPIYGADSSATVEVHQPHKAVGNYHHFFLTFKHFFHNNSSFSGGSARQQFLSIVSISYTDYSVKTFLILLDFLFPSKSFCRVK